VTHKSVESHDDIRYLKEISNNLIRTETLSLNACLRLMRSIGSADGTVYNDKPISDILENLSFRSKNDEAVRRLRLADILNGSLELPFRYLTHLDIIHITNILVWVSIWGVELFMKVKSTGLFNTIHTFIDISSQLSSFVKRFPSSDESKQIFGELNTLTGYLQTDISDTDWEEELKKLAHAGAKHGLAGEDMIKTFKRQLAMHCSIEQQPYITLREFIESGRWVTSGSSSIGRVDWSYDEASGHFKARKNMLEYLYSSDYLYELVVNWNGKLTSRAFTKDELSKRRLAVASNIESYLAESWTLANMGHFYKAWDYLTLDESPATQHFRTLEVAGKLANDCWALPFDFKSFDHQPTSDEIETILEHNMGGFSVPAIHKHEWLTIKNKIISSYRHNTVSMQVGDKKVSEQMTGGLPSGVRFTSLIGNQWNLLMTLRAREIVNTLRCNMRDDLVIGIKGDDTYIISSKSSHLLLFRYAYEAINAVGLDSKFGISQKVCEFLRVEMSKDSARGWANRTIPTITQRKPWSTDGDPIDDVVATVASSINTLERRLQKPCHHLHDINKRRWSKFTKQSVKWLELPREYGGFGLYPWKYEVPDVVWPRAKRDAQWKVNSKVQPQTLSWVVLNPEEQEQYSKVALQYAVNEDAIPGASAGVVHKRLQEIRKLRVRWSKVQSYLPDFEAVLNHHPIPTSKFQPWPRPIQRFDDTKYALEITTQYKIVSEIVPNLPSLAQVLQTETPSFYARMKLFERNGWHRTNAFDLACGDIPVSFKGNLHPQLTVFLKESLKRNGIFYWRGRERIKMQLYNNSMLLATTYSKTPGSRFYMY